MSLLRLALEQQDDELKAGDTVAFDLDGTVAFYNGFKGAEHIGEPIPKAIALIKQFLEMGVEVIIFTARVACDSEVANDTARSYIEEWCVEHIGQKLFVTAMKLQRIKRYYDDRARQVIENLGIVVTDD